MQETELRWGEECRSFETRSPEAKADYEFLVSHLHLRSAGITAEV